MTKKTDGKTVKLTEVPSKKIRLFRSRDSVKIDFPEDVRKTVDNAPLSVEITPMTHREAELRKRLSKRVEKAEIKSVIDCGVSYAEFQKFQKEAIETNIEIFRMDEEKNLVHSEEEMAKLQTAFNEKWSEVNDKLATKDDTCIYEAEDDQLENSVKIVAEHCMWLHYPNDSDGNSVSVAIDRESIESLHLDLFKWVLTQIEGISYLTTGEVMGL